jgi:hypothetical protein
MLRTYKITIIFLFSFIVSFSAIIKVNAAEVLENFNFGEISPSRILSSVTPNEYWVSCLKGGLVRLEETEPGQWTYEIFDLGKKVYDATGPDIYGRIFCSYYGSISGSGVMVFNCYTRVVDYYIQIGNDYPLRCIALSSDQTKLYVVGRDWPRVGQWTGGWVEGPGHPNTGLVWEINTSTYAISSYVGGVGVMPETIYYSENGDYDKLFVYTLARDNEGRIGGDAVDILSVQRELGRTGGFPSCFTPDEPYCNDLVKWSDEEPLMALCNKCVAGSYDVVHDPKYNHGLWIFDTNTEELVNSYEIIDISGHSRGVSHLCISSVRPGIAYLSLGYGGLDAEIAVFDMGCGEVIEHIQLGIPFTPEFIYEIPDGRLIATGDTTHNIVIFDPTQ